MWWKRSATDLIEVRAVPLSVAMTIVLHCSPCGGMSGLESRPHGPAGFRCSEVLTLLALTLLGLTLLALTLLVKTVLALTLLSLPGNHIFTPEVFRNHYRPSGASLDRVNIWRVGFGSRGDCAAVSSDNNNLPVLCRCIGAIHLGAPFELGGNVFSGFRTSASPPTPSLPLDGGEVRPEYLQGRWSGSDRPATPQAFMKSSVLGREVVAEQPVRRPAGDSRCQELFSNSFTSNS
ncbi:hypothetical protein EYF80_055053 [Liparis tanakae]|uniref:Uncharacterized protein n=1 Tax=Liparis tanakae TaxID=230148 RepID=A0A4Z2F2Q6_9TELE|nr:hypothetical protein EYF80_055053 [Liparis tanakae]